MVNARKVQQSIRSPVLYVYHCFGIPEDGFGSIPKNYVEESLLNLHQDYLERKLNLTDEKVIGKFFSYNNLQ